MVIGMSCTPSSALLHVDRTTIFSQSMSVAASEQEHVLSSQHPAGLDNVIFLSYSNVWLLDNESY